MFKQSSCESSCSVKEEFLKISQNTQEKHLCCSLFINKLQAETYNFSEKETRAGIFQWISRNFQEHLFCRTYHGIICMKVCWKHWIFLILVYTSCPMIKHKTNYWAKSEKSYTGDRSYLWFFHFYTNSTTFFYLPFIVFLTWTIVILRYNQVIIQFVST